LRHDIEEVALLLLRATHPFIYKRYQGLAMTPDNLLPRSAGHLSRADASARSITERWMVPGLLLVFLVFYLLVLVTHGLWTLYGRYALSKHSVATSPCTALQAMARE
jgi:hypothetical protein